MQPVSAPNLGNALNAIVRQGRAALFNQGELVQLTYTAFDYAAREVRSFDKEPIELTFPVGYNPDRTPISARLSYSKDQLLEKYQHLSARQLSINAIIQLVTIVEAMITDILRSIIMRYPQKLGAKRSITIQAILESSSIEDLHFRAADSLVNELAYKSPAEYAEDVAALTSVNLLECPAYHSYLEIKASRDIFVHNRGVANAIYLRKAGTHARVAANQTLPADLHYFLESYERCLQISEWLELRLHEMWHSSELEARQQPQLPLQLGPASSVMPPSAGPASTSA